MAEVIEAGVGRTGTASLKWALEVAPGQGGPHQPVGDGWPGRGFRRDLDEAETIAVFERHSESVRAGSEDGRLLVCELTTPFPHGNEAGTFGENVARPCEPAPTSAKAFWSAICAESCEHRPWRCQDVLVTTKVDAPPAPPTTRPARSYSPYLLAVLVYIMVRDAGYLVLLVLADHHDRSIIDLLTSWDGDWYVAIAEHGFDGVPDTHRDAAGNHTPATPYGFFPALPTLMRVVAATGMGAEWAGLVVSAIAGVVAAMAIFRIGRLVGGSIRVGLVLVALWGAAPMSIVLSMSYTEALFTACAAWALVGVLEKRWYLAALSSVGAGLTRSTAVVVIAVVGVAALIAVVRDNDRRRALACVLVCPLGLLGWWGYVAHKTGSLTGWFDIQREGWFTRFDGGVQTLEFVGDTLATGKSLMESVLVLVLLTAVVLAVLSGLARLPWPVVAYGAGVVILVIGTAGLTFLKGRFLLPGFTLLIPVALGLANRQPRTMIAATAAYTAVFAWFNAYALTGWQLAI